MTVNRLDVGRTGKKFLWTRVYVAYGCLTQVHVGPNKVWVYEGLNASGNLWPSVYTGFNVTNGIRVLNAPSDVQLIR